MIETSLETIEQAKAAVFYSDATGDEITLNTWLMSLLVNLWNQGEEFSGKRPFGSSDWDWEPASALVELGLVSGKIDDFGEIVTFDEKAYHQIILDVIVNLS